MTSFSENLVSGAYTPAILFSASVLLTVSVKFKDSLLKPRLKNKDADDDSEIIANGFIIDVSATPFTLTKEQMDKFALSSTSSSTCNFISRKLFKPRQTLIKGGAGWTRSDQKLLKPISPEAVFSTDMILSPKECEEWIIKVENTMQFDETDFIFKTGKFGFERMHTGARRYSATMVVTDEPFAQLLTDRLLSQVPVLPDGRKFLGIRDRFLFTRYSKGQYFAPHYDGCTTQIHPSNGVSSQSEFTVVLYLTNDFEGGATHYLPGEYSEVDKHIAVQPPVGYGVAHRGVTVLHAAGRIDQGTKYVMQFGLMYEASPTRELFPLRWGV